MNDLNVISVGHGYCQVDPYYTYAPILLKHHLENNTPLIVRNISGTLNIPIEKLIEFVKENGAIEGISKSKSNYSFVWYPSFITINFNKKDSSIYIDGYFSDTKILDLFESIKDKYISKSKKNFVFSIVRENNSLKIKNLGNSSVPLLRDNYNPSVIEDFEYVISSFKRDIPPGRICILNGEPGTGKTHLIRNFLSQVDSLCLIVPSNLISSLDGPDFLPLLLSVKEEQDAKSIVLIIEDGDTCLVPRKSDNMSTITSLLNLSDGILGSMLDIKIIVTTNAYIKDMDQAILRPGRLCRDITVGPLEYEQANRVYQRLMESTEKSLEKRKFYTLAEIYSIFNNKDNPMPIANKYKPIGFHSPNTNAKDLTLNLAK